jgi:hypothetical protein
MPSSQDKRADGCNRDQDPPACAIDIMQSPNQNVRWPHLVGQPAKVGSSMRKTHHEDAETIFG